MGQIIRKKILNLCMLFLFLTGLAVVLYPTISDLWNQERNRKLITNYATSVKQLDNKSYKQALKDASEYNKQHTVNNIKDAFSEEGDYTLGHPYDTLLNPNGDEIMGYVEVPSIHVKLAIYHGVGVTALENGVGHVEGTSLPIGGESTHAVLSGHRGLPSAKLFTDLDQVKKGDVFYISVLNEKLAYEVDQILTVLPSETDALAIEKGKDYVTLLTCTPYAVNTHRLLVRGHRIPYEEETYKEQTASAKDAVKDNLSVKLLIIGIIVFLLIVLILWRKSAHLKNKKA